jgi:Fe-S-cluster-containing hydrogenase component 2
MQRADYEGVELVMSNSLIERGYIDIEDLRSDQNWPSADRYQKGAVAVIECMQEIPCNPCKDACPYGAIVLEGLTVRPQLIEDKCIGCGLCIAKCPGQAIFVVDKSKDVGTVTFPYEYLPLPEKGMKVTAVNRAGEAVCEGLVTKVVDSKMMNKTRLVTIAVPVELVDEVRFMKRVEAGE